MKKESIVSVLVIALIIVGVQVPTASAVDLKKISLTYSDHIPPMAGGNIFLKTQYFPKVKEEIAKLGYDLDVTFYHAESLYTSIQQVQACEQGLINMTVAVLPYEQARFPLHELLHFPFMGCDAPGLLKVWSGLDESVPEFRKELANNFVEFVRFFPTQILFHTNLGPDVLTVEQFKGQKIHCSGLNADIIKSIGGVPIRQNPGDWYTSLDRNLFNGIIVGYDMVGIMKLYEVLNTHIQPYKDSWGHTPVTHIFSRRKFVKLPPEVQKVFKDNFQWASETITEVEKGNLEGYTKGAKAKGNNFVELTPEQTAEWRNAAEVVHQHWVQEMEEKGLPGQKVYDNAKRIIKDVMK